MTRNDTIRYNTQVPLIIRRMTKSTKQMRMGAIGGVEW